MEASEASKIQYGARLMCHRSLIRVIKSCNLCVVKGMNSMAGEQKTKPLEMSPEEYIESLPSEKRRAEARALIPLFERASGEKAQLWGGGIIGFGEYHYRYQSGHSGTAAKTGFSPRKAAISLYLYVYDGALDGHLARLGKHKMAKGGCVYVNKLADIDLSVLEETVKESVRLHDAYIREQYV